MSNTRSELGTCPFCGTAIPVEAVLVEYEADGEQRVFAECYEWEQPVQPQ